MVSKELLSEVLGHKEECDTVEITTCYSNMELGIRYTKQTETCKLVDAINIYELSYKCKEWAFKNGYTIESKLDFFFPEYNNGCIARSYVANKEEGVVLREQSNTEPEAIFKACQWILDNKGMK